MRSNLRYILSVLILCASASPWQPCEGFSLRPALLRTELGILFRQLVDQGGVALARMTKSSTAKEPAFCRITCYNTSLYLWIVLGTYMQPVLTFSLWSIASQAERMREREFCILKLLWCLSGIQNRGWIWAQHGLLPSNIFLLYRKTVLVRFRKSRGSTPKAAGASTAGRSDQICTSFPMFNDRSNLSIFVSLSTDFIANDTISSTDKEQTWIQLNIRQLL